MEKGKRKSRRNVVQFPFRRRDRFRRTASQIFPETEIDAFLLFPVFTATPEARHVSPSFLSWSAIVERRVSFYGVISDVIPPIYYARWNAVVWMNFDFRFSSNNSFLFPSVSLSFSSPSLSVSLSIDGRSNLV